MFEPKADEYGPAVWVTEKNMKPRVRPSSRNAACLENQARES
jgi:hypothetical protein